MRVLIANLRHFYQRRWLWAAYAYFGLLLCLSLTSSPDGDQERVGSVWFLVVFSGILTGGTTKDVINKPFVSCLPRHPQVVREVVFLLGLAVAVLGGILSMRECGVGIQGSLVIFCAAICLSMALYLAGAQLMLTPWVPKGFLGAILFGGMMIGATMIASDLLPGKLESTLIRHPLWVIACGMLIGSVVWRRIGRREWSRQVHSLALRFATSGKGRERYAPLERQYTKEAGALALVASFFLNRMNTCPDHSVRRYIWGTLYARLGSLAAWWKWLVFASIALVITSVYTGLGAAYVFLWASWLVVPHLWPPLHSPMLVPAGRRERFLATTALAGVITGIVGAVVLIISIVSVPLSMLVPAGQIWDIPLVCRPVPPVIVSVPFMVVPVVATLYILLPKRLHIVVVMAIAMAIQPPLVVIVVITVWLWMPLHGLSFVGGPTAWISMAIVFAWMLFGAACWHKTRRCSLACY